jgi:hypothetical protein
MFWIQAYNLYLGHRSMFYVPPAAAHARQSMLANSLSGPVPYGLRKFLAPAAIQVGIRNRLANSQHQASGFVLSAGCQYAPLIKSLHLHPGAHGAPCNDSIHKSHLPEGFMRLQIMYFFLGLECWTNNTEQIRATRTGAHKTAVHTSKVNLQHGCPASAIHFRGGIS